MNKRLHIQIFTIFSLILMLIFNLSCNDIKDDIQKGNYTGTVFYNPYENSILYFKSNNTFEYLIYNGYPSNDNLLLQKEYSYQVNVDHSIYIPKLGMLEEINLYLTTTGNNIGLTNTELDKGWIFDNNLTQSFSK